jgi:tRNA pseudouridine55 synthase
LINISGDKLNGYLIVDKPCGWTSHDVVAKLRSILHERRIGHSGTLDPMATGVLAVFVGRATRAIEFCAADDKEYSAVMRLGLVTDSQDITGNILSVCDVEVSDEKLADCLGSFVGEISQIPPMYSAVKINGKKMYELARKGINIDRPPRQITIHKLELNSRSGCDVRFKVTCSKGTYIRTLCHDIGQALGCGACLSELRRTRCGSFLLDDAKTLDEIAVAGAEALMPIDHIFASYPAITLGAEDERHCRNGNPIAVQCNAD